MSSPIALISLIFSVILGNFLCAELYSRNTQQNPWQKVNSSSYAYNTQEKTTPWPTLGRNQNNNVQPSSSVPQWIRPNNGPNWVRNTPQTQNVNSPQNLNTPVFNYNNKPQQNSNNIIPQDHNSLTFRNPNIGNKNTGFNQGQTNALINYQSANSPRHNINSAAVYNQSVQFNQRGINRNSGGVNSVISSGSAITNTEGIKNKNQEMDSSQTNDVDDNELRQFAEDLLSKETNNAAQYVSVNLQGMTTSRSTIDQSPLPLLSINQAAYSMPTISKILQLHDNYIVEASQNEVYTAQEKNEENDLLDIVLQTPVMQYTKKFLIDKGKIGKDPKEFKDLLHQIWFNMYSRGRGKIGSSGFEHVFLAELKNNQVSGLHNWIYFNEEEKKNNANYLGYMKKIDLGGKGAILKFHFTFQGVDKPVGSMFIGTSPELEMALYSACFILRPDKICPLKMNGHRFIIRTYTYRYRGKNMIGSAFPEI